MNILHLVEADRLKKLNKVPNPEFEKLEEQSKLKDKGQKPLVYAKEELRSRLTPVQYSVTQEMSTEKPFSGKYLRMKDEGIYVCVVCENPLFASECKFDSHCGWPSFSDVMAQGKVTVKRDTSHGSQRVEITCSMCGSHLGHVFDDGPKPSHLRYCVNSAALEFKKHTTV